MFVRYFEKMWRKAPLDATASGARAVLFLSLVFAADATSPACWCLISPPSVLHSQTHTHTPTLTLCLISSLIVGYLCDIWLFMMVLFLFQTSERCELIPPDRAGPELDACSNPDPEPSVLAAYVRPLDTNTLLPIVWLYVLWARSQKKQAAHCQRRFQWMQTGCDCSDQAGTSSDLWLCQVPCHASLRGESGGCFPWEQPNNSCTPLWGSFIRHSWSLPEAASAKPSNKNR